MKKKGQSTDAPEAAPAKGKKKAVVEKEKTTEAGGLAKYIIAGVLVLLIVIGGGAATLGWLQFGRQQEINDIKFADLLARQQLTLVNEQIRYARSLTEDLAETVFGNSATPQISAEQLGGMLPGASAFLVPPGQVLLPDSLSYSAQETIQQSRTGEQAIVSLVPGKPATMYIAASAPNKGVVLLTWPLDRLQKLMSEQDLRGAFIEVTANKVTLFTVGQPGAGTVASPRGDSGVVLNLTLPPGASDPGLLVLYLVTAAGTAALSLLVMVSVMLSISRGMKKDSALLIHLAADLQQNPRANAREKFSFDTFEVVTRSLRKLATSAAPAGSARKPAGNGDSGLHDLVAADDTDLLIVDDSPEPVRGTQMPAEIFRAYDIRGVVSKTLTPQNVELIGRAFATEALHAGQNTVIVARDGRLSGTDLRDAFVRGVNAAGADVIDIGMAPTPVLYYATKTLDSRTGVCITGSHNPPDENGLKMVIDGETLHGDRIKAIKNRVERGEVATGAGKVSQVDLRQKYMEDLLNDIVLARPMKVAVDTANGVTGEMVPKILKGLGCEVIELFTEIDGNFPNHSPDTSKPANYAALRDAVKHQGAEIGIALDGDGDRLGVVTPKGEIIWADRLMMLFARDLLSRTPGADIIFDVKCSRELPRLISQHGGRPLMWQTGHSLIKAKLRETNAPLAGEMSGHIFFADRWYGFDDGMYAMSRLLEILSLDSISADEIFDGLQTGVSTPEISIPVSDQAKFGLIDKLKSRAPEFSGGTPTTIDGLRVDFDDGWGLVRASNTGPTLVARFEGRDDDALARIQGLFKQQLEAVNPQLRLPF